MPPAGEGVVDVDELFGQFVEVEPALGVAVNFQPGRRHGLDRAVAKVEAGAFERGLGCVPQTGLGERGLQPRPLRTALTIMIYEFRLLQSQPELEFAKLRLRQEIITASFSNDAGARVLLDSDVQVLRAIDALPDAKGLADSARSTVWRG